MASTTTTAAPLTRTDTASHYEHPAKYTLCPGCHDDMSGCETCPQMLCQSTGLCHVAQVGTCYDCGNPKVVKCDTKHYIYDDDCTVRERVWLCSKHHHDEDEDDQEREEIWNENNGEEIEH